LTDWDSYKYETVGLDPNNGRACNLARAEGKATKPLGYGATILAQKELLFLALNRTTVTGDLLVFAQLSEVSNARMRSFFKIPA
jgi:hypothetical protein